MSDVEQSKPPLPPHDHIFKLVLVGDSGVGKTSLLLRYVEDKFSEESITSIGPGVDSKTKIIEVDGKKIVLEIWDTAGQERFRTISGTFYKGAHGIIVVYDISDEESYTSLSTWMSEIDRYLYNNQHEPIKILVGNKTDLESSRKVTAKVAKEFADKFQMSYYEASAKFPANVDKVFEAITKEIMSSGIATGSGGEGEGGNTGETIQITSAARGSRSSAGKGEKKPCCGKNS